MNNPFDYLPDSACDEAFRELVGKLEKLKGSIKEEDASFCRVLESGVMLGVLIADDPDGVRHTLYAFSGQIGDGGFHYPGFVEPVFDYLQPDGYFKRKEADISRQNREIEQFKNNILAKSKGDYEDFKVRLDAEIAEYKDKCRLSKQERDAKRESGSADESEMAAMIRQSQFEKAELHRLKKRAKESIQPLEDAVKRADSLIVLMKEKRRKESEDLQRWLFSNFRMLNARGESKSLIDIFAATPMKIPPSGAGECCAPKLLQAAYVRGWNPVAIAEYWYGKAKEGNVRLHGRHYPACRGRCLPVLGWMLQGLSIDPPLGSEHYSRPMNEPEIIFENEWFCVVNKPSGMLSVPGKGAAISVQDWLKGRYGSGREIKMAHRLDQDTSGLIIAAFGETSYKTIQALFSMRKVKKQYIAELEGDYRALNLSPRGIINLPLSPDWLDRPRQRVDFESGKEAVTEYEFISVSEGTSRVRFYPLTGRTHQLRMHAASPDGLGMPIVGDRLYGKREGWSGGRLLLHAHKIEFTFPIDGKHYCFESPVPF